MDLKIKRVYEEPSPEDGLRILVDRIWPRGIKKEKLAMHSWEKELAPSTELRKWYGHDPEKYEEFKARYFAELDSNSAAIDFIDRISGYDGTITLIFSAKDMEHSNAAVLADWMGRHLGTI